MKFPTSEFIKYLVEEQKPIYCASSLFSPLARMGIAHLAAIVEQTINDYLLSVNIDIPSSGLVFLPFRDTEQTNITGSDKAQRIYEIDISMLRGSSAILARIDGLAKDSGVAMEIGYAYGLGIPIGVLLTDFMWEGVSDLDVEWQVDPIIQYMSDVYQISHQLNLIKQSYYLSNLILEERAITEFVRRCFQTFECSEFKLINNSRANSIYIDFMGGRYNWAKHQQDYIKTQLSPVVPVYVAQRFTNDSIKNIENLQKAAQQDIHNALNASVVVFSGDSPEMDFGSASLLGLCRALNKVIIFQYSSPICYKGDGGQEMKINLMIEQAADFVTSSENETISVLNKIVSGEQQ